MRRVQQNDMPANNARWRLPRVRTLVVALAAAGAGLAQQAQSSGVPYTKGGSTATTYRVVNLGSSLLATIPDINAKGQVSFSAQTGSGAAAGYFYNGTAVQDIGTLGGGEVLAVDLNDVGQITGSSTTSAGIRHAYVWSEGGGMLDIGVLPGAAESQAAAINNFGVVTGVSDAVPAFPPRAFRWSLATGMENLGALAPGLTGSSYGDALNDAGVIAGEANTPINYRHAFTWTRTSGLVDIDTLNSYDSLVVAVGAKGEVAGNHIGAPGSFDYHPFLWTSATGMVDLGTLGGTGAAVLSMTPDLQMAGLIDLPDGTTQRAMSWTPATGMRNLGTLGGQSSRAIDVNIRGQVVGYANNAAGDRRGFVWTFASGMRDLNNYLYHAPPGLVVDDALAINDSGAIVATSNAGLVLLRPDHCTCGHVLGPVVASSVVKAGAPLQAAVAFVDEDRIGTRSVSWSWGDGSGAQAGTVRESGDGGNASASHSFAAPGIYPVTVTVVDRRGVSTAVGQTVVVTAPSGGMVAGTGAVMSPAGASRLAPTYAGKAHFRFIAPTRAQGMPATLQFDLPGFNFRSQDVRLLERQGAQHVFEGSGTVRGAGGYKFRLSTAASTPAGGQGRFAMKVWHTDPVSHVDVVDYDNARASSSAQAGRVMEGSVVVE